MTSEIRELKKHLESLLEREDEPDVTFVIENTVYKLEQWLNRYEDDGK